MLQKKFTNLRKSLAFYRQEASVVKAELHKVLPLLWADPFLPATDRADLIYLLQSFKAIMANTSLVYWLDYGTLLGAWRWGNPLPWDYDGDIGYLAGQWHLLAEQAPAFAKLGIQLTLLTASYRNASVDLFPWIERNGCMVRTEHLSYQPGFLKAVSDRRDIFPATWVNPLAEIRFAGDYFPCPNQVEQILRKRYGNIDLLLPYHLKTWFYPQFYRYYWIFARYHPDIHQPTCPVTWTIVRTPTLLKKFGVTDGTHR